MVGLVGRSSSSIISVAIEYPQENDKSKKEWTLQTGENSKFSTDAHALVYLFITHAPIRRVLPTLLVSAKLLG